MIADTGLRIAERKKPIDQVRALYEKHGLDFAADRDWHDRNGVVVAMPTCFVMGTAVELEDGRRAWFIQAAAGNLRHLMGLFPWPLPFIAFRRKPGGRTRVYSIARFKKLCLSIPTSDFRLPTSHVAAT